jgi:hypothetical protein
MITDKVRDYEIYEIMKKMGLATDDEIDLLL